MVLRDRLMEAIGALGLYGMKITLDEILVAGIKSRAIVMFSFPPTFDFTETMF